MITKRTTGRLQRFIDGISLTYASEVTALRAINKRVPNAENLPGCLTIMPQSEGGRFAIVYLCDQDDPSWMDVFHGAGLPVFGV